MRTFTGVDIVFRLLNGTLSGAQLETALTTDAALYLGPWIEVLKAVELNALLNNPTALAAMFESSTAFGYLLDIAGPEIAASDTATEALSNNSTGIKTVVTNSTYLDYWKNTPANKSRLAARINASGSKLKSQTWTANGTWTAPGSPIVALSLFAVGPGGNGGASTSPAGGGRGGGAAEYAYQQWTTGLPTTTQTITVPTTPGTAASFGAFLTADSGESGSGGPTGGGTGGGSTAGSGIYDTDPANGLWMPTTGSVAGSAGGNGGSSAPASGSNGTAGLSGSGGTGGTPDSGGSGGSGIASSGGGGGINTGFGASPGGAASGYGTGGGGASLKGGDTAAGGAGGGGYVKAWWVEA